MAKEATVTARIDAKLGRRLAKLAQATGRSKSWVINAALRAYVESELDFVEKVEAGLRSARAGRLIPQEEVKARFFARFGKAE